MDNSQISTQEGAQHSQFAYEFPSLVKQAVQRTFVWMALGLAITGLTAIFAADSNFTYYLFSGSGFLFYGLLIGYVTKRDLSRWGSLLYMALIGLIIASVVNWFLASTTLMWITTYAGVLIFVGLTAYDTQKLKKMLWETAGDEELSKRVSLIGALNLYLDFINLFLSLFRILGRRR